MFVALVKHLEGLRRCTRPDAVAIAFSAAISLIGGLLILTSWLANHPEWIGTHSQPACVDLATFSFLAGIALLAAALRRYSLARAIGLLLALGANLHIEAYTAGFPISLQQLFVHTVRLEAGPETSLVFFLFGCALAQMSAAMSRHVLAISGAVAIVISTIGLVELCKFFEPALHPETSMPLVCAIVAIALGCGLFVVSKKHLTGVSRDLPASSSIIGVVSFIAILGATDAAVMVRAHADLFSHEGVKQAYATMRHIRTVTEWMQAAESAERGYLLTGDEAFRARCTLATDRVQETIAANHLTEVLAWKQRKLSDLIERRLLEFQSGLRTADRDPSQANRLIRRETRTTLTDQIETESSFVWSSLHAEAITQEHLEENLRHRIFKAVLWSYVIGISLAFLTAILARLSAKEHERTSMKTGAQEFLTPSKNQDTAPEMLHVLLIDDSQDVMVLVDQALRNHGCGKYRLSWASCIKDGFRELINEDVDAVLLDLDLPETSGLVSYACVRGCAPRVPIIVLTAGDSQETEESMIASGVDDFLLKQEITGKLLVQTISGVIGSHDRPPQMNLRPAA